MPSTHQHGYTYDLFVSYSSSDAEWMARFLDDLTRDVNRFAISYIPPARLVWNAALLASVADSALLDHFTTAFHRSNGSRTPEHRHEDRRALAVVLDNILKRSQAGKTMAAS